MALFQLDGELFLAPGFPVPPNTDYKGYHAYIDEVLPAESPYLYGLHPNAEIDFLTTLSDNLFRTVFEMQPRDAGAGAGGGVSREERVGISRHASCRQLFLKKALPSSKKISLFKINIRFLKEILPIFFRK